MLEQMESKLDTGLDRAINAIVGWVKTYLQSEQRKTDFKPESDFDTVASAACQHVVQQMIPIIKQIRCYLDGENLKRVMSEIGVRLHRIIYEHLQQFQYTTAGKFVSPATRNASHSILNLHVYKLLLLYEFRCNVCDLRCQ